MTTAIAAALLHSAMGVLEKKGEYERHFLWLLEDHMG